MTDLPDRDELVGECVEFIREQQSIFGGKVTQKTIDGFRLHAAQNWLKDNPLMVLHVAEISRSAAQTMLTAVGVYLAAGRELNEENQRVIGELLIKSNRLLSKKGGEDRANRTVLNFAIILLLFRLKRQHRIKPTRNPENKHQSSGCDIVANAAARCGFARSITYDGVKRVWDKRRNLLGRSSPVEKTDDELIAAMMHDLQSYIETVATADLSMPASSVRAKIQKT